MSNMITIGDVPGGGPAQMDLGELLATRLLVQGNSGSGKSHLLRRLLEQSARLVQQAIIDPEGDFVSLAEKFGHLVIDGAEYSEMELHAAGERMRLHRASVVLNLEGLDADQQMKWAAAFLGGMFEVPREYWYPVLVVVDEAQLFAPAAAGEVSDEARRASLGAMTNLMCRGRKRGLAGVIATQRLAKLAKNVAAEASNFLMGRTFLDIDMARAADLLGMERRQAEAFRDLARGTFVALGPALCRRPVSVRIGAVETESRSAGPVLAPFEPPSAPVHDLILAPLTTFEVASRPAKIAAAPPPDLLSSLAAHGEAQQQAAARTEPEQEETPESQQEREARMMAVLREMLESAENTFRPAPVLYQDFLVRCRIAGLGRNALDLKRFNRALATARSGVSEDMSVTPEWQEAQSLAQGLPEDVQSVFLCLARAAIARQPCPADAEIARVYGTVSQGRARRVLEWLEDRNIIVLRKDGVERRILTVIGPGWETLPGEA
ncbi:MULTISPECIES: ATP-binding protein [Acetobacter]|uniref:ATP-binding protein n=1 Tax=Acetobacter TaxID=434 RepID=UPI000A3877C7|nr:MULTISPECIES: ATP-binding protein [Acetobacter]MBS0960239.1 ATP-binding protein [Acetobacter thailandicus]MBS1004166.1 ATP-binding protein [Acetobacter thailandicus]OUJ11433.1 ATP-binding protein [Acetobacter sp. DsW_059]